MEKLDLTGDFHFDSNRIEVLDYDHLDCNFDVEQSCDNAVYAHLYLTFSKGELRGYHWENIDYVVIVAIILMVSLIGCIVFESSFSDPETIFSDRLYMLSGNTISGLGLFLALISISSRSRKNLRVLGSPLMILLLLLASIIYSVVIYCICNEWFVGVGRIDLLGTVSNLVGIIGLLISLFSFVHVQKDDLCLVLTFAGTIESGDELKKRKA